MDIETLGTPLVTRRADAPVETSIDRAMAAVSRRRFLRAAAVTGGGLVAVTVAACAPAAAAPSWRFGSAYAPGTSPGAGGAPTAPSAAPGVGPASPSPMPGMSASPSGTATSAHDAAALAVVKRFLDGEWKKVEGYGNQPIAPEMDGDTKVYRLSIDKIDHLIDAQQAAVKALGFNKMWPGPRIDVTEGDKIRAIFTNNLGETTGIHFHGLRVPNNMDGVPHITQDPIQPGASFTQEFVVRPAGSHMYHSHHNATDQVGRGLLGAFIVHPKDPAKGYEKLYGISQDIVWISNDELGGFTINGRGFPATAPIVATVGDKILIRFMNEGIMTHPWHLHGMPMHVVARDGWPLGSAAFYCDTLGVNPGERWDVIVDCEDPGAWAFHCHILPHAEGSNGMFGMVTALVIQKPATASLQTGTAYPADAPIAAAAAAAGSTAFACRVPRVG
jgi:manganese oxidase